MQRVVVKINGRQKLVPVGLSIRELILSLRLAKDSVVTVNGRIVTKRTAKWLKRGDIVTVSSKQATGGFLRGIAKVVTKSK